ncbi:hypothetical protein B0H13DRAFT_2357499 [Mycena leptocephala]|nr:hypothetical protein B0H13DRAFT_2357499 [Mycena leptocephala]
MVINTTETGVADAAQELSAADIEVHQAYAAQQRFDGHEGEITYKPGDLVQVLDPKFHKTFLTIKKILPEWSGALKGEYSGPRLRPFVPPRGSSLEAYGKARRGNATEVSSEPLEFEGDEEGGREEAVI